MKYFQRFQISLLRNDAALTKETYIWGVAEGSLHISTQAGCVRLSILIKRV